jgi:dimethylhistidine N-methyltransferase
LKLNLLSKLAAVPRTAPDEDDFARTLPPALVDDAQDFLEAGARGDADASDTEPYAPFESQDPRHDFARELLAALSKRPREISPKFFYDATGSALFDRICELPEYYPTRTEMALLREHAAQIAQRVGPHAEIVEFGAGSVRKVRVLLDAMVSPRRFVPIDISAEHLHASAAALVEKYPALEVQAVAADFTKPFALPPSSRAGEPGLSLGFFPGSSIGNFTPGEALQFLRSAAQMLKGGALLIGVDLVKDPAVLHAAYNDAAGVTAAFNRNLLVRANNELGADFVPERFAHYAYYEPRLQRVEMHLVSDREQHVQLLGRRFEFAAGESLHTENSYKYTVEGFRTLARRAGFVPDRVWCDARRFFSLHFLLSP